LNEGVSKSYKVEEWTKSEKKMTLDDMLKFKGDIYEEW
jgi:hypothetical protein